MSRNKSVRNFAMRYPSLGAVLCLLCIQYYLLQIFVAINWVSNYSLEQNTISDLGNNHCGMYNGRFVCSPDHALMNVSFVVLGLLMIAGVILVYQKLRQSLIALSACTAIAAAGFGAILVGLFPENSTIQFHIVGAALSFVLGNIGLICFGFVPDIPRMLRLFSLLSGIFALIALVLFFTHNYFGLGIGGMERIVAYPQSLWLIILGTYLLIRRK